MTGPGRTEPYRGRLIAAQAMSAKGGVEHRSRVAVTGDDGFWRGPFVDYDAVFATEQEARAHGIAIGMEVIDMELDGRPCRWRPINGRWDELPTK